MQFGRTSEAAGAYQQNVTVVKVYTRGSGCSGCFVFILLAIAAVIFLAIASAPPR